MSKKAKIGTEIERKYVIKMPSTELLSTQNSYTVSDILQIYLPAPIGETHRVRSRQSTDNITYTETRKINIDAISSTEIERVISEAEFCTLSQNILIDTHPVRKTRYTFIYKNQLFEIDVYPEWKHTAIMETELSSRECIVEMPPFIEIVKEVTLDKSYSNRAMAHVFPKEEC